MNTQQWWTYKKITSMKHATLILMFLENTQTYNITHRLKTENQVHTIMLMTW